MKRSTPPVTVALIAVLVAVHGVTASLAQSPLAALVYPRSLAFRAMVGGQQHDLVAAGELWRLFTSVFLHVDALHLLGNTTSLWVLGYLGERAVGSRRWGLVFLAGGVGGSVFSQLVGVSSSDGASGGAFALVGALLALRWREGGRMAAEDRWLLGRPLAALCAVNLLVGALIPGIDSWAHGGGFGLGLLLGLALRWEEDMMTLSGPDALHEQLRGMVDGGGGLRVLAVEEGWDTVCELYRSTRVAGCELAEDADMLLFQWGTHDWGEDPHFSVSLTRQLMVVVDEEPEIWQLTLDWRYPCSEDTARCGSGTEWCATPDGLDAFGDFFRAHSPHQSLSDTPACELVLEQC